MIDISSRIKNIGHVLRLRRVDKNMTQGDVAEALNISRSYISAVENGTANPSLSKFMIYCDVLNIDPDEILRQAKGYEDI